MSYIWLAETNGRAWPLVLIDLVLALGGVFGSRAGHTFGAWLFDLIMLKGQ